MSDSSREQQIAEWQAIRAVEPAHVIATYKGIAGIPTDGPLPAGVTFDAMIAAIVEYEEREGRFA